VDVVQLYETEIRDPDNEIGVRFATVPARSLAEPDACADPYRAMELLELEQLSSPLSSSLLPYAIASILQRENDPSGAVEHLGLALTHREQFTQDHPELLAFAEYVTYANIIPVEHSPLGADSLGSILASGSGAGIGAAVGVMVAGGPTPLLFVTVPLGMILCGSAKGIGEGLGEGFRHKIRKIMGVPTESVAAEPAGAR
jgi:hypothetical protein